jgi:lipid II:glycine glycyltransferase (peptidoglycan interpeptide bridge formation enzyme)
MIAIMLQRKKFGAQQEQLDPVAWDAFVRSHPAAHLLQSSGWGRLKSRFGWRSEIVTVPDADGRTCAGALVLYRRVAGLTIAYAPRGPLTDWDDLSLTGALFEALVTACRRQGALFLKVEPELPDTAQNRARLAGYGLRPSPQTVQPPSSIILDLGGDEDEILQRMKSKWRYNIRLAERKGVTVRCATPADLTAFNALMGATGERDGFAVHSPEYYRAAFEILAPDQAAFLIAEYEGKPLAALVVAVTGQTALYLWGASSERERNRMPNYALQWAAMRWARERGATRYDLWGIPDDLGKLAHGLQRGESCGIAPEALPIDLEALPGGGLWGVYRFKQGFGGRVVRTVGAWDLPLSGWGYGAYRLGIWIKGRLGEIGRLLLRGRLPAATSPGFPNLPQSPQSPPLSPNSSTALLPSPYPITTPFEWWRTLAALPSPHVLQSWEWGVVKGQTGWRAERFALCEGASPTAAFQFLWRQLAPGLPVRIGYVPKGPILDWTDSDCVELVLAQIEQLARNRGCIFVKIDPDVREDTTTGRHLLHALERRGWRYSPDQIQFKNTAYTDLSPGEAVLLDQMKSKWRYNIRLAERRGLCVRQGGPGDLATFHRLYVETGRRDGFLTRPFDYYRTTWESYLAAQGDAANPAGGALLLAEHPDDPRPVAGLFLLKYGERVWYFNGASSERHRRDMPNYLLQWEALRWAMAQGCTLYDWWGAPTDLEDTSDPLQGVWQFKQGFGAHWQPHIGAWDYPVSPLLYRLYTEVMPQVLAWMRRKGEVDEETNR